ncbi:MAG: chloride channel protein [Lentisphaeria bacterium]|nr:chloride channel protein [Lentisphaeria bacterium]
MFESYKGSVDHPKWYELCWLTGIAILIGILSGLCAILLRLMIAFFHNLFFAGKISLDYKSIEHTAASPWGEWVILIPVLGALLVAFIVRNFAPSAHVHGVPEIMNAIYYKEAKLNPWSALSKCLTSAISIGSGGSIGREGPIVQITATIGSAVAGYLQLPGRVRTVLLAAAAAGGIAGSFNSPIGGIFFAVELFLPAISAAALLPVTISAATAALTMQSIFSTQRELPIGEIPNLYNASFSSIFILMLLGVLVGLVSTLFIYVLCNVEMFFSRYWKNYYLRHGLGMLIVGVEIYLFFRIYGCYYVEGLGYSTVFDLLTTGITPLSLLLMLLAGKMLATWITLGSGGSGGVFCPALFIGGIIGALVAPLAALLVPNAQLPHGLFILAGMAAAVGGITGAVFSGIVMVAELTGNYSILTAAALVSVVAFAVRRALIGGGIYSQKLELRNVKVPEGLQSAVLTSNRAIDLAISIPDEGIPQNYVRVDAGQDIDSVLRVWNENLASGVVLYNRQGVAIGIIGDAQLGRLCRDAADRMV